MPGRDHALHNEKLCDLLLEDGNFDDWVVTAAFYAAIHLVDHQLFPLTIGSQPTFANFNQYCHRAGSSSAPHRIRRDLVATHLQKCSGAFEWLYDASQNSRYNSYKVGKDIASRAKNALEKIKKVCTKE